mgnify:CR=1 FL=1
MFKRLKETILEIIQQADLILLGLCCAASVFGIAMIYSATRYNAPTDNRKIIVQTAALLIGIVVYFGISMIDLEMLIKRWKWIAAFDVLFILLLKTPFGVSDNTGNTPGDNEDNDDNNGDSPETTRTMTLKIGNSTFTATLADNATAQAFAAMLPMSLSMSELNNNEKYVYLDQSLPVQASSPGTIQTGDIMLYGSACVVLFYKTFSTSYSYTRIGRVDNPDGLASAVGSGSVTVLFER